MDVCLRRGPPAGSAAHQASPPLLGLPGCLPACMRRCLSKTAAHPEEAERLAAAVLDAGGISPNNTTDHLLKQISFRFEQLCACL